MEKKKGFSLVELLVAMAIIAVLISIAAYGISILQRNSRNTMRRKEVDNIRLTITEAELNTNQRVTEITNTGNSISLNAGSGDSNSIGTYLVSNTFTVQSVGHNCVFTGTAAANSGPLQEDVTGDLRLCFSNSNREIGAAIEGTTGGYKISLGR
jgi:prepilin-type N-terminal cleavage/methylation domain-containing protein